MYRLALLLALGFLAVGLLTGPDYGLNWDSPEHLMRGNAILNFFLTGRKKFAVSAATSPILIKPGELISRYLPAAVETADKVPNLPAVPLVKKDYEKALAAAGQRFSFYQNNFFDLNYFISEKDSGHPALADILAALGNRIFYVKLGWLGDLASYQLFGLLVGALGIFMVSLFTYEITKSATASIFAGLSLFLSPSFLVHSHINLKDPIVAVFFAGAVWSFWHFVKENRLRWGIVFSIFIALGLGVKWTIGFVPLIILPWLFVIRKTEAFKNWFKLKKLFIFSFIPLVLTVIFLDVITPPAWKNLGSAVKGLFSFYWSIGVGPEHVQPDNYLFKGFNIFPTLLVLAKTPEIVLFYILIGILSVFIGRKDQLKSSVLVLFWVLVPLIRLTLPNLRFYGGVNQFMEILPAMAVMTGLGINFLSDKTMGWIRSVIKIISVISFIILIIILIGLHPNENLYFNGLIGGIKGAKKLELLDWFAGYGNTYKHAADWLNKNLPPGAKIAHLDGSLLALSPMYLRDDISISPQYFSGFAARGEYIVQIPDVLGAYNFVYRYPLKFLKPVHEVTVGGVPVLIIYKNDKEYQIIDLGEEHLALSPPGQPGATVNGQYWQVDLGKAVRVTKIIISELPGGCQAGNSRFIDDLVGFFEIPDAALNTKAVYAVQEKHQLSGGRLEYDFAAEAGRFVRIYIESNHSCFLGARIEAISYLP